MSTNFKVQLLLSLSLLLIALSCSITANWPKIRAWAKRGFKSLPINNVRGETLPAVDDPRWLYGSKQDCAFLQGTGLGVSVMETEYGAYGAIHFHDSKWECRAASRYAVEVVRLARAKFVAHQEELARAEIRNIH